MPERSHSLRSILVALRQFGVIPAAAAWLEAHGDEIRQELQRTIADEVPAFAASGNPDIVPEQMAHGEAHFGQILQYLSGSATEDLEFVRQHAARRAEQRFPLEATLHAYRCGHRVLSRWIREAALASADETASVGETLAAVADFSIEYTDSISTIATSEYVAQTRQLAEAEGDRRGELLAVLLGGYDEADGRVARLLRRAGYLAQRQSFCVAVTQSVDPTEMEFAARVRRIVDAIDDVMQPFQGRVLTGVRDDRVVTVFSATRRISGWTVAQTNLSEQIQPYLLKLGNAVLVGISTDMPSTSQIPNAVAEAQMAFEFADPSNRVVSFAGIPVRRVLLKQARDSIRPALPKWSGDFFAADDKARGSLVRTLRAYADADMNVLKAARSLDVHPNTIYTRIERISDITGQNGLEYHALTELLLTADCRP
ncbi:MAG: PucR family transcriptional regulator [Woeseiaceae bacterium]